MLIVGTGLIGLVLFKSVIIVSKALKICHKFGTFWFIYKLYNLSSGRTDDVLNNNEMAIDGLMSISQVGLSVPENIAVVGFNYSEICQFTTRSF